MDSETSRSPTNASSENDEAAGEPNRLPRPTNTRVIQLLTRPQSVTNHSYVDYSLVPYSTDENILPGSTQQMDFHQRLHALLDWPESQAIAAWLPHGRAFAILNPVKFESSACKRFFGHSRWSKFLNQLGRKGYKELTTSRHRNTYYSQLLLRGLPHLTKYMPPPKRVARRLTPDPGNEPDFDIIQLIAPLPGDAHFGRNLTVDDIILFCRRKGINEYRVLEHLKILSMTRQDGILQHRVIESFRTSRT